MINSSQGPLFGRFIISRSRGGSSDKKGSENSSRRVAQSHFNRLFEEEEEEEEPRLVTHKVLKGSEDTWTSPDLEAGNELSSMSKAPTRPLPSAKSNTRSKNHRHSAESTLIADYG